MIALWLMFGLMTVASLALAYIGWVGAQHGRLSLPIQRLEVVEDALQRKEQELESARERELAARDTIRDAADVQDKLQTNRAELQQLTPELEAKKQQLTSMKSTLAETLAQVGAATQDLNDSRDQLAEAEARRVVAKEQLAIAESRATEAIKEREAVEKERTRLKVEVHSAEATLKTTLASLAGAKGELDTARAARESAQKQAAALEAQSAGLAVQVEFQQAALAHAREDHLEKVAEWKADEAMLRERIDRDLKAVRVAAEAEKANILAGVEAARADAERRVELLKAHLDRLTEIWDQMRKDFRKDQNDSLEQWKEDQKALRELIENQWKALEHHIQESVKAMNRQWSLLTPPDAKEQSDRLAALWEPVFAADELAAPRHDLFAGTEQKSLDRTKAYMRKQGLVYPDRVIHAFHTCLKTNDMSLLTVLAGISGTGKSVLPKAYAEAMGMHFLGVAVQPRWDSPQDLFGFYNYMEGAYRATELSRALVQMERFNTRFPDGASPVGLPSHMALVLLDEMNLARVEYYFSEFLSKLEVRRQVDPKDANSRRDAEIVFEAGSLPEGTAPTRVFPFGNVLFVGTMNEDETTQTLSDKVVDRANVLRFGKPANLAKAKKYENPPEKHPTALSFDTWSSWVKGPDALAGAELQQVQDWMRRVNDNALAGLRRPVGYRVSLAVEQYVANYPRGSLSSDQALKLAFADQMEQRVMPKLRGLDNVDTNTRKAMEQIREVLAELGDEPLVAAFEQATSADLFLWHGVERQA